MVPAVSWCQSWGILLPFGGLQDRHFITAKEASNIAQTPSILPDLNPFPLVKLDVVETSLSQLTGILPTQYNPWITVT